MEIMAKMWEQVGSITATVMLFYAVFDKFFPPPLRNYIRTYTKKLTSLIDPYISIKFSEFEGERMKRSEAYTAIQTYLSANSSERSSRLKAEVVKDSQTPLVLSMDDNEEITDEFQGVKLWWFSRKLDGNNQSFFYRASYEKRFYNLKFHRRHRDVVTRSYIKHVLDEGKAIASRNRQLKLYTNNPSNNWYGWKSTKWSHVVFEHPASFDTLALDPKMKEDILKDLVKFQKGKEYYTKVGKAWKRGYLLYGPPGTGKSTMIAAMANFLNYDIYDLELTAVKENAELRKLLIETSSKSILVIEDIDCSLDLTGQRKKKKKKDKEEESEDAVVKKALHEEEDKEMSKVTLSGLLNVIDGIWSACGGERVIVFTTNYVDKLDPALIRRGRMDKHIELSYCCYEAFKVLARNYLDVESHRLYPRIEELFQETQMTPADVAENLTPKSVEEEAETCFERLIEALETAKLEAKKKAEEEAKKKAEEEDEAKKKEEEEEAKKKADEEEAKKKK
ncbi:hypothetical protein QN277_019708 [Acacia crassicarpa]|uniref:AAA+ ATPase domain-containing protein n=1 Tax=Acacia crassicarpa TaxID=499986 RepID=A0AAE1JMW2_9FABA|nr:hypothetical protein QN277_019708 [Acacia crassicarpa]